MIQLGELGTNWAVPRLEGSSALQTESYESGHQNPGQTESLTELGRLIRAYQESQRDRGLRAWRKITYELGPLADWLEDRGLEAVQLGGGGAEDYQTHLATCQTEAGLRYTSRTVSVMITTASGFYQWLKETGRAANNPFYRMKRIKREGRLPRSVPTVLETAAGLARLARFAQAPTLRERRRLYRLHVIAEVLYASGLRLSELAALRVSDLDWERGLVQVRQGKGGRARTAFLGEVALKVLGHYVQTLRGVMVRGSGDSLWGCQSGKTLEAALNGGLKKELGWTSHTFRHALGTHLLARGCDLRMIQMILGHEDLKSTSLYTRVSKEDLRSQLDTYHPRGG